MLSGKSSFVFILVLSFFAFNFKRCSSQERVCPAYHDYWSAFRLQFNELECYRNVSQSLQTRHPDQDKTVIEVILSYSYNASTYQVTSNDGYISTTYRITGGPVSPPPPRKGVVLLFHGLGSSSAQWIVQHGNKNLAFKLADEGYEVWLANVRGTSLSKEHVTMDAEFDLRYWDFTVDDIATRDLPLIIDQILLESGVDKINYVCHSMGCMVYLVALSQLPELNDKIKTGVLLAPAAFLGHSYGPYRWIADGVFHRSLEPIVFATLMGRLEQNPIDLFTKFGLTTQNFCTFPATMCGICDNFYFALFGFNPLQLNYTNVPNIFSKLPDTSHVKIMFHFMQNMRSCQFRRYDYGSLRNILEYGVPEPPAYNLSRVTTPTYIFYGEADNLVTPWDAAKTRDALPPETVRGFYAVDWPAFTHFDFFMAIDADTLVYNRIVSILSEFN